MYQLYALFKRPVDGGGRLDSEQDKFVDEVFRYAHLNKSQLNSCGVKVESDKKEVLYNVDDSTARTYPETGGVSDYARLMGSTPRYEDTQFFERKLQEASSEYAPIVLVIRAESRPGMYVQINDPREVSSTFSELVRKLQVKR